MSTIVKQIEVKTLNGERIAVLRIEETILSHVEDAEKTPQPGSPAAKASPSSGGNGTMPEKSDGKKTMEDPMTDSQKRYLFRIMAERGKTGDEAHEELKRLFKVKTLKDVSKLDASRTIEQLLAVSETNGNGGDDGSPF